MKKLLLKTMLLLCALVAGSASVWADEAVFDFTSMSAATAGEQSFTSDPVTIVCGNGAVALQSSTMQLRWYSGQNLTVSISSGYITGISITKGASDKGSLTASSGTLTGGAETGSGKVATWSGSETSVVFTSTGQARVTNITVTYSNGGSDPVAVTGVTLDESTLELEAGETATLTATVAPGNATDKVVAWSSSDEDVATVENGVVTAVSAGTATITVTTRDGSKTATCNVTVTAAPVATALLDFTTNDWGISVSPTKTIDATDFTSGGYTVTIEGSTGNGYYFDNDNIMIGKQGASLTLPAFPFNVKKIKVYGTDGASGSVTFNIFVDETAVSTEVTSSKITHEFIINAEKQAAGNRYKIKVTNAANMRIAKIEVFGYVPATITSAGYATLYTPAALDFSGVDGLTAYTAVKDGDVVRLTQVSNVPANTGVVLEGAAKTYSIPAIATSTTAKGELTGNATDATAWNAESGYTYYVLASTGSGVEFRPVSEGEIAAGKAFLKVADGGVHSYSVVFGDETGISEAVSDVKAGAIYDLSGRRVVKPTKGLYIVNGKKIMVK